MKDLTQIPAFGMYPVKIEVKNDKYQDFKGGLVLSAKVGDFEIQTPLDNDIDKRGISIFPYYTDIMNDFHFISSRSTQFPDITRLFTYLFFVQDDKNLTKHYDDKICDIVGSVYSMIAVKMAHGRIVTADLVNLHLISAMLVYADMNVTLPAGYGAFENKIEVLKQDYKNLIEKLYKDKEFLKFKADRKDINFCKDYDNGVKMDESYMVFGIAEILPDCAISIKKSLETAKNKKCGQAMLLPMAYKYPFDFEDKLAKEAAELTVMNENIKDGEYYKMGLKYYNDITFLDINCYEIMRRRTYETSKNDLPKDFKIEMLPDIEAAKEKYKDMVLDIMDNFKKEDIDPFFKKIDALLIEFYNGKDNFFYNESTVLLGLYLFGLDRTNKIDRRFDLIHPSLLTATSAMVGKLSNITSRRKLFSFGL